MKEIYNLRYNIIFKGAYCERTDFFPWWAECMGVATAESTALSMP